MRIAIGCDHRGLELKQLIIRLITQLGHSLEDFGGYTAKSVDYPDIAKKERTKKRKEHLKDMMAINENTVNAIAKKFKKKKRGKRKKKKKS